LKLKLKGRIETVCNSGVVTWEGGIMQGSDASCNLHPPVAVCLNPR